MHRQKFQSGFTLAEIVVATTIFAVTVTAVLGLFDYVLKINRQVQATRQVAQASRNFTETLSREIRNGRIDYDSSLCDSSTYPDEDNQHLGIVSFNGDRLCFYFDPATGILNLEREIGSQVTTEQINPPNFTINPNTFRFIVQPKYDPTGPNNQGLQPMVTILAEFEVYKGGRDETIIPYQTTISTDIYDPNYVPHDDD